MSDAQKMEATTIETAISPLSKAEAWLAGASARVQQLAQEYRVPEEIADDAAYKEAKASRASVRRDAKELDDERKRMTREMDDALKRFRADVKGVLEPLTDLDAAYKEALDAYEERWGRQRRRDLEEAYEEYAPALMELVPIDRLISLRGSERGKAWLNRSTNVEAAKASLRSAIDQVARDEQTLNASVDEEDLEAAKADLFTTLDLGAAIRTAQARAEQRERVRRLEEERRQREEEARRIAEEARLERERRRLEQQQAPAPVPTPQAVPEPQAVQGQQAVPYTPPEILPNPMREHVADTMGQPERGKVPPFVFCAYGTRADADAFSAWCKQRGIKPTVKPTGGSVYRIVRK